MIPPRKRISWAVEGRAGVPAGRAAVTEGIFGEECLEVRASGVEAVVVSLTSDGRRPITATWWQTPDGNDEAVELDFGTEGGARVLSAALLGEDAWRRAGLRMRREGEGGAGILRVYPLLAGVGEVHRILAFVEGFGGEVDARAVWEAPRSNFGSQVSALSRCERLSVRRADGRPRRALGRLQTAFVAGAGALSIAAHGLERANLVLKEHTGGHRLRGGRS